MLTKIKSLSVCLAFIGFAAYGQQNETSFTIVSLGSEYSPAEITDALNGADLCGFFYLDNNREMVFDDGAVVELKSSTELQGLPQNCFIEKSTSHKDEFWKIANSGHLIRVKQTVGK